MLMKGVIAAMALVCVIALALHPGTAIGLALVGLLFVPVLLWTLGPMLSDVLPTSLERRRVLEIFVQVSRFQRPPPSLL